MAAAIDVGIHLQLTGSFQGDARFPRLRTPLDVTWTASASTAGGLKFSGAPDVRFGAVEMNLGSFLGDFLGPVVSTVNDILGPAKPILDILTTPIPGISSIAGPITMVDLARFFGSGAETAAQFISAADGLCGLAETLTTITDSTTWIPLGSFEVDGNMARNEEAEGQLLPQDAQGSYDEIVAAIDALGDSSDLDDAFEATQEIGGSSGGGFSFPLFDNPASAFGLFLGRDVTLVAYELPELDVGTGFSIFVPILGPLGARIGGHIGATVDVGVGFDTRGLRQFAQEGFHDPSLIFGGFYLTDTAAPDGSGPDVPELTLTGGVSAAAELNLLMVQAGVGGGLNLDVNFDLYDPDRDGKVYFDEIDRILNELGPLQVFDVSGRVYAQLFAYLKLKIGFITLYDWNQVFADITLASFDSARPPLAPLDAPAPPVLAPDPVNGVLSLNVGPGAGNRGDAFSSGITDEDYEIRGIGLGAVEVRAFGTRKQFFGVTEIRGDFGGGNDVLDASTVDSRIRLLVSGGAGDDRLTGGEGNDELDGGEGNDTIYGGEGNDILCGSGGADQIYGEAGRDTLYGDPADDAGAGSDYLDGGAGNDTIFAGAGDDKTYGQDGSDEIYGSAGNDVIVGGSGDDTLLDGGTGRDLIDGQAGQDTIHGGPDDDVLTGGQGDDLVYGNAGNDHLLGLEGNDILVGGLGDDVVEGGLGCDTLLGDEGTVSGTAGSAVVTLTVGSGGRDELFGDDGNDQIFGGEGEDYIEGDRRIGGRGADYIDAGPGDDVIYGCAGGEKNGQPAGNTILGGWGRDTIYGGYSATGNPTGVSAWCHTVYGDVDSPDQIPDGDPVSHSDLIYGDLGSDQVFAGVGDDVAYGLAGSDTIVGGWGKDTLYAGDAASGDGDSADNVLYGDSNDSSHLASNDPSYGDANNPSLPPAGDHSDRIYGDAGHDEIHAAYGNDWIDGGAGNDWIYAGVGDDQILGGTGSDDIFGGWGKDAMFAGISASAGGPATDLNRMWGDVADPDAIPADATSDHADVIYGDAGRDRVAAGSGPDMIYAGMGSDVVLGNAGDDLLYGGSGDDLLVGGSGKDRIFGEGGRDVIWGGRPEDVPGLGWTAVLPTDGFAWWEKFNLDNPSSIFVMPPGFDQAEEFARQTVSGRVAYLAPRITPQVLLASSVAGQSTGPGTTGDGEDEIYGGAGTDWLFGGGDRDLVDGGSGNDYLDGGASNDTLRGGVAEGAEAGGDDILRGGQNDDVLRGGDGIDQLYGEAGDDLLFGDAGTASGDQTGQRLWGGPGFDTLYAYAPTTNSDVEKGIIGDELFGGDDGDKLYGNLRRELLIGDSTTEPLAGNDYLHGDYLRGPLYARSTDAGRLGGGDYLFGGFGQDQLFGGGGNDVLYGGQDSDWLEGMDGNDRLYGGSGVDILALDVDSRYSVLGDTVDGHYGNLRQADSVDDVAVDMLLVQGDKTYDENGLPAVNDEISLTEVDTRIRVDYHSHRQPDRTDNEVHSRQFYVDWRSADASQTRLVEQFQVTGLMGNDSIRVDLLPQTISQLATVTPGKPWVTVLTGGPGDDEMRGTPGRDWINGGPGSDTLYGMAGDDRLWGDFFDGDPLDDTDVLYGGQGDDDLIGGVGENRLYAWSRDPLPPGDTQFGVFADLLGQLHDDDGDLNDDGYLDHDQDTSPIGPWRPPYVAEDTGVNRVLGSSNPDRRDVLYGGTGLDFLYGNGGGGQEGDQIITRHGTPFRDSEGGLDENEAWNAYAKSTTKVWYLGGSEGNDQIDIDYVTNPYNPLFGRHLVTLRTNGSFDPRFRGFDSFTAFDGNDEPIHDQVDHVYDVEGLLLDRSASVIRDGQSAYEQFVSMGVTATDIAQQIFAPEPDFLAIIVDALGGNDTVTVHETVQKTVWVDAGDGDDSVQIEPQLAYLPDGTDAFGNRNDVLGQPSDISRAFDLAQYDNLGPIATDRVFTGLSIDSARSDEPDIDWYSFQLAATPVPGDVIEITPLLPPANVQLAARLYAKVNGVLTDLDLFDPIACVVHLDTLAANTSYWLEVQSVGSIPTNYEIAFRLAGTPDKAEPNDSYESAYPLGNLPLVSEISGLTLNTAADVDWLKFNPRTCGSWCSWLEFRLLGGGHANIALADKSGVPIPGRITNTVDGAVKIILAGLESDDYLLRITGAPVRYRLVPHMGLGVVGDNTAKENAFTIPSFVDLPPVRQELTSADAAAWFTFTLSETANANLRMDLRSIADLDGTAVAPKNVLVLDLIGSEDQVLRSVETSSDDVTATISLQGLGPGQYWLRVLGGRTTQVNPDTLVGQEIQLATYPAYFELSSSVAPRDKLPLDLRSAVVFAMSASDAHQRRDVLLGGAGNDRLEGGSGEDWIFGNAGNDVLAGGLDEQASDLMFGGEGDDIFQVLPDWLPAIEGTTRRGDNAASDFYDGGPGENQVLYLGGDQAIEDDPNANPHMVRDFVALGYDRFLQRLRLTSLVWDVANEQFAGEDVDGDGLLDRYLQKYAFFQSRNIQQTVISTRGGNDIVHADPNYILGGQTWGIARGDVQAGATAFSRVEIRGGSGEDALYGGASNDTIYGEEQGDYIAGGEGDDRILGNDGDDHLFGCTMDTVDPAIQAGTPDQSSIPPVAGTKSRLDHRFDLDLAAPLDDQSSMRQYTGVSLPAKSQTVDIADAFALEGAVPNNQGPPQELSSVVQIGDVNGDDFADYLASGAAGTNGYVLLGPVQPDSLYRVDTGNFDQETTSPDLRIRGNDWSYEVTVNNSDELATLANAYRIGGRAELILDASLGTPLKTTADVNRDGKADLLFLKHVGSNFVVNVVFGSKDFDRDLHTSPVSGAITVPDTLTSPAGNLADVQVQVLDWNGDTFKDVLVMGKPGTAGGLAGYLFSGAQMPIRNYNVTSTNPVDLLFTLYDDAVSRSVRLGEALSELGLSSSYSSVACASNLVVTAVGDVNEDQCEDLLIGNDRFIQMGGPSQDSAPLPNLGRAYLLLGRKTDSPTIHLDSPIASDTRANYIWESFALGATVSALGDVNHDGYSDFAFGRSVETNSYGNAVGSVFLVGGSHTYRSNVYTRYSKDISVQPVKDWREGVLVQIGRNSMDDSQWAHDPLQVAAGDFDGDGHADLAVGTPTSYLATTPIESPPTHTADPQAEKVYVFWSLGDAALGAARTDCILIDTNHTQRDADSVLTGEVTPDHFGYLPTTSSVDLDGDEIDDLAIGAPSALVTTGISTAAAERVYVVYGSPRDYRVPKTGVETLASPNAPGNTSYVVDQPTGEPFVAPGSLYGTGNIGFDGSTPVNPFLPQSGTWSVDSGRYMAIPAGSSDAISLLPPHSLAPAYELRAMIHVPSITGRAKNGYLIFDYQSPTSFKYAGFDVDSHQWRMGQCTGGTWQAVGAPLSDTSLNYGDNGVPQYDVRLRVDGSKAELWLCDSQGLRQLLDWDFGTQMHLGNQQGQVGLGTRGSQTDFDNVYLKETERWYRFSTLGDGQIGNQIKLQMADGQTASTSRPALEHTWSTSAVDGLDRPEIRVTASGTLQPAGNGFVDVSNPNNLQVGGGSGYLAIIEIDLSSLLSYVEHPEALEQVLLTLPYNHTGSGNAGTVYFEVLDAEGDSSFTVADGAASAQRFRQADGSVASVTGSPFAGSGTLQVNLTSEVREALAAGRMRLTLRIRPEGVSNQPLNIADLGKDSDARLEITTATRYGVVADVYSAAGQRFAAGQTIVDTRNLDAGTYLVRIYDPFDNSDYPDYLREGPLDYQLQIAAPKVGDAHAPTDQDVVHGGPGDDTLAGNQYVDRLFGGFGFDHLTGEPLECRDLGVMVSKAIDENPVFATVEGSWRQNPPASELSSNDSRPIDFDVEFSDKNLERVVAYALGLANHNPNNDVQPLRALRASDLTRLVELDASYLDSVSTPLDVDGLQYAVNLEYLTLAGSHIADISQLESGIRLGYEEQGEVGLRSLRYLDLDANPLVASPNHCYPAATLPPLEYLAELHGLEFLSVDRLSGSNTEYTLKPFAGLTNLRWLSASGLGIADDYPNGDPNSSVGLTDGVAPLKGLTNLRYLVLNDNHLADVRPLAELPSLYWLELRNNAVSSIDALLGQTIIDNGESGYYEIGPGWTGNANSNAFEDDYRILPKEDETSQVRYEFENLKPGVDYEVYATWPEHEMRTTEAVYGTDARGAMVVDVGEGGLFNSQTPAEPPSPPPPHTVVIDTTALTITVDGQLVTAYGGTTFRTSITTTEAGELATFLFPGDLVIGSDHVTIVGSRPASLLVLNDVFVAEGAILDASAKGVQPGAGEGGESRPGGPEQTTVGGGGGGGFVTVATTSTGTGSGGGYAGLLGQPGNAGEPGDSGTTPRADGADGWNNPTGGGTAGTAGAGGQGGSGGLRITQAAAGGARGQDDAATPPDAGNGDSSIAGVLDPLDGRDGGEGHGGANDVTGVVISTGGAGGAGGGGGSGGGGGGGASGGGGGGAAGRDPRGPRWAMRSAIGPWTESALI